MDSTTIKKYVPAGILLTLLFLLLLYLLSSENTLRAPAGFYLICEVVLLFVCIYAIGVLGYKVTSPHLQLESRVDELDKSNSKLVAAEAELKLAVSSLLKILYMMNHEEAPFAGQSIGQKKIINEYLKPIEHLVGNNLKEEVNRDFSNIPPEERRFEPGAS